MLLALAPWVGFAFFIALYQQITSGIMLISSQYYQGLTLLLGISIFAVGIGTTIYVWRQYHRNPQPPKPQLPQEPNSPMLGDALSQALMSRIRNSEVELVLELPPETTLPLGGKEWKIQKGHIKLTTPKPHSNQSSRAALTLAKKQTLDLRGIFGSDIPEDIAKKVDLDG